jgi:hypothetical protein
VTVARPLMLVLRRTGGDVQYSEALAWQDDARVRDGGRVRVGPIAVRSIRRRRRLLAAFGVARRVAVERLSCAPTRPGLRVGDRHSMSLDGANHLARVFNTRRNRAFTSETLDAVVGPGPGTIGGHLAALA